LINARSEHTATLLANGKVLMVGEAASAELYNPAANTWSEVGGLAAPRYDHTATLLGNGKVMVVGGIPGYFPEFYKP
jgi:hypothetical protein